MDENETFIFPDYQLNRLQHYNNANNRQTEEYVQASISNRGRKYIWMLRGGMAWNASKNGVNNGMTEYWKTAAAIKNGSILDINTRNKSYRPSVYFYGLHTFSNTKSWIMFLMDIILETIMTVSITMIMCLFVHLSRKIIITSKRMQTILWRSVIEID